MRAGESSSEGTAFDSLDTGGWSLLHRVFRDSASQDSRKGIFRYLKVFLATSGLTFWIPLDVAAIYFWHTGLLHRTSEIQIPYLWDINWVFATLVVNPLVVSFIVAERDLIPEALSSVFSTSKSELKKWQAIFPISNIVGQIVGLIVAAVVSYLNYDFITEGTGHWGVHSRSLNLPGKILIYWQMPFYTWCLSVYAVRYFTYIVMLTKMASRIPIKVALFHYDKCSGLKKIGVIGYRNQYIVSILLLNLVTALWTLGFWQPTGEYRVFILALVFMTFALVPVVFFGPLLPFRKKMLEVKITELNRITSEIRTEYAKMIRHLTDLAHPNSTNLSRMKGLEELRERAEKIPVWPFDVGSLRRFLVGYVAPILPALLSVTTKADEVSAVIQKYLLGK